jgi:hypothetical protein
MYKIASGPTPHRAKEHTNLKPTTLFSFMTQWDCFTQPTVNSIGDPSGKPENVFDTISFEKHSDLLTLYATRFFPESKSMLVVIDKRDLSKVIFTPHEKGGFIEITA